MMGSRDPQKQLWSYHVNLDKRVRSDHPLRKLNEVLKLDSSVKKLRTSMESKATFRKTQPL